MLHVHMKNTLCSNFSKYVYNHKNLPLKFQRYLCQSHTQATFTYLCLLALRGNSYILRLTDGASAETASMHHSITQVVRLSVEFSTTYLTERRYAVQLVEALRYKPEGCGFESRWSHWSFSVT
jgi:hypothetical protein